MDSTLVVDSTFSGSDIAIMAAIIFIVVGGFIAMARMSKKSHDGRTGVSPKTGGGGGGGSSNTKEDRI